MNESRCGGYYGARLRTSNECAWALGDRVTVAARVRENCRERVSHASQINRCYRRARTNFGRLSAIEGRAASDRVSRGHVGMGVPAVEAGVLSGEAAAKRLPEVLFNAAQHRRGELHLPADAERKDHCRMAGADTGAVPLRGEGPSGHHALQSPERRAGAAAT